MYTAYHPIYMKSRFYVHSLHPMYMKSHFYVHSLHPMYMKSRFYVHSLYKKSGATLITKCCTRIIINY